eukprot:8865795-Alexandrium_andersonii.AAC.2
MSTKWRGQPVRALAKRVGQADPGSVHDAPEQPARVVSLSRRSGANRVGWNAADLGVCVNEDGRVELGGHRGQLLLKMSPPIFHVLPGCSTRGGGGMRDDHCHLQDCSRNGGDEEPGLYHYGLHIRALDGGPIRLVSEGLAERYP